MLHNRHAVLKLMLLALPPLFLGAAFACKTEPEKKKEPVKKIVVMSKEEQLSAVRKLYNPPACFTSSFRIEVQASGGSVQRVDGSLRVDNAKNRLYFRFTDTIFGVTLSRVIIAENRVYVRNPYAPRPYQRQVIPLGDFEVRGLGRNSIRLPFRLFQDLLFARLPPDLFREEARIEKKGPAHIDILVTRRLESYRYHFEENRLRELDYREVASGDRVEVELKGVYRESMFPRRIEMAMFPARGTREKMSITFRELNLKASCQDRYFTAR